MNTSAKALFLALAINAAAADSVGSIRGAVVDSELVAAKKTGTSYCTWSPDRSCYKTGWPSCCDSNSCPKEQPVCDKNPGSNYCTWSPDYKCYEDGWPSCCDTNALNCPKTQPACDKKPTRSPTKKPTNNNRRPTASCVPDDRPRPVRDGQRFRFNLVDDNAECVDSRDQLYEYGQFVDTLDFSECADLCVNSVPSNLAFSSSFRGFDFECASATCNCLYDAGTLNSKNSNTFQRINKSPTGRGSISGTTPRSSAYCGKLVGAEAVEDIVADA